MGFKCGIVGLPNVGKSTLFNALTNSNIATANFPFCTIEANTGIVHIPDPRLEKLRTIVKPMRLIPTSIEFVDVAGLIEGASKGEGLGNQFLQDIRNTDAIIHVVRCFENENITHFNGHLNPIKDIYIINTEMVLSDLQICEKTINNLKKKIKYKNLDAEFYISILEKCFIHLENGDKLCSLTLSDIEKKYIASLNLLTLKPAMYIANVDLDGFENNEYLDKVRMICNTENSIVIPVCATVESEFSHLKNNKEHHQFMTDIGLKYRSLNKIICAGYSLLNLQTYFTAGIKEVRSWTIPENTTAIQAAKKIHSDLSKGFIRAQTISFEDFILYKGARGAKEAGKMRSEGKDYIVRDGDVIHFLFNI